MQARAILEAAAARIRAGGDAQPEIMIPLVASVRELDIIRDKIVKVAHEVQESEGLEIPFKIGTMIELPRAALTADQIAGSAEFFSFGTNDLTQMTWGFSRDDVEASFFSTYLEQGVFPVSPFESLDIEGVGALVKKAVELGRSDPPGPAPRRLRRARGRPALGALLRRRGSGLRLVLTVPGPGRPAGGRPLGRRRRLTWSAASTAALLVEQRASRVPSLVEQRAKRAVSRPRTARTPTAADP